MALPPTIPTSFVPHFANAQAPRPRFESIGALTPLAYVFLGIVVLIAVGVFLYGRVLTSSYRAKEAELTRAQDAINQTTVESFARLHSRLESSKALLGAHPALSSLFSSFEKAVPAQARFNTLHFSIQEGGSARIDGTGSTNNFNTLAVMSQAFARDTKIKDAVFSNIRVTRENSVSFSLSAKVDQRDFVFKIEENAPSEPSTTL